MTDKDRDYGIYMNGAPKSPVGTMLFEVDCGIKYWLSAPNHLEALTLAAQHDAFNGMDWDSAISVEVVPESRGRKLNFNDGEGNVCSMWEEWLRDPSARMVGCSEW